MGTGIRVIGAGVLALAWSGVAEAHHYNRGHFVTAYRACAPASANTITVDGTPACAPPVPVSDCATSSATALRLRDGGKTSFLLQVSGRRRTRIDGYVPTLEVRVLVRGVEDCAGNGFRGELRVHTVLRLHSEDPACATGRCTLPDFEYTQPLACSGNGSCKLKGDANSAMAAQGLAPLPLDHGFTLEVLKFEVLDLAGRPFLVTGMSSGVDLLPSIDGLGAPRRWLASLARLLSPEDAGAYGATGTGPADDVLARYVRAFAACDPGSTNTATGDGQAACAAVPLSDCATDPANAVVAVVPADGNYGADTKGRGKIDLAFTGDGQMVVAGYVHDLQDCAAAPYTGPLTMEASYRTTLRDPGCLGGSCTLVDGPLLRATEDIAGGSATLDDPHPFADLAGPSSATDLSAEMLRGNLLDRSGHAVLSGPSLLVRCNTLDTGVFCFGN